MPATVHFADRIFSTTAVDTIRNGAIVVEDGLISWVGAQAELPARWAGLPPVHHAGTLLPGLIETHAHLDAGARRTPAAVPDPERHVASLAVLHAAYTARQLASLGVTTVQSLGASHYSDVALREAITQGLLEGPRVVAAGPVLTFTAGHGWPHGTEVDSPTEIRHAVRDHHKAGADVIKVMATGGFMTARTAPWNAQFDVNQLRAVVEEATRLGKHTAAHAHATEGIRRAVEAGIDYIAHASFIDADGRTNVDPQLADQLAAAGTFVDVCSPPSFPAVPGETIAPRALELYQRGVQLVTGHDIGAVLPANGYLYGLIQLQAAGLPPREVLLAATTRAAAASGLAGVTGALLPGYSADFIVTPGNPITDVAALANLSTIVMRGKECHPDPVEPFDPAGRSGGPGTHPNDVRAAWLERQDRIAAHPLPIPGKLS